MKIEKGWAFPDYDEFMVKELGDDGRYQAKNLDAALEHVTDWTLAIDGGAHIGTWSRIMAGRFVQVIAAEPSPDTYEALCANMKAFGCDNVDARHVALGEKAGRAGLTMDERGTSILNSGARFLAPGDVVDVQTIDSWELPTLGFLKLDVEGSEQSALLGARETLQRCKPIVLFEDKGFWRRFGYGRQAPQSLLTELGFVLVARVSMDQIWRPR